MVMHALIHNYSDNILLVQEAAHVLLMQAQYLKYAASTTLELITVAQVRLHTHMFSKSVQKHTHIKNHAQRDEDNNLNHFSNDAVKFIAAIWRSYLGSGRSQLWPSHELRNTIIRTAMYVLTT